jgi:hypothetical protein
MSRRIVPDEGGMYIEEGEDGEWNVVIEPECSPTLTFSETGEDGEPHESVLPLLTLELATYQHALKLALRETDGVLYAAVNRANALMTDPDFLARYSSPRSD